MKSLTIHNIEEDVYNGLKEQADAQGTSLNKLIKKFIKQCLGMDKTSTKKRDVSFLVGSMSDEELEKFKKDTADTRQIDPDKWQ